MNFCRSKSWIMVKAWLEFFYYFLKEQNHDYSHKITNICKSTLQWLRKCEYISQSMPGDTCDRMCACPLTCQHRCQLFTCQVGTLLSQLQHYWLFLLLSQLCCILFYTKWNIWQASEVRSSVFRIQKPWITRAIPNK